MKRVALWLAAALLSLVLLMPAPGFAQDQDSAQADAQPAALSTPDTQMPTYGWAVPAAPDGGSLVAAVSDPALAPGLAAAGSATPSPATPIQSGDNAGTPAGTPQAASAAQTAAQKPVNGPCWAVLTGSRVRVRIGPGKAHKSVGLAKRGEHFVVLGVSGEWARVQAWPDVPCYVFARYVSKARGQGVFTGASVNLRLRPALTNDATPFAVRARKDQPVTVIATVNKEWKRIIAPEGIPVFIHRDYLRSVGSLASQTAAIQATFDARLARAAEQARKAGDTAEAQGFARFVSGSPGGPGGPDQPAEPAPTPSVAEAERQVLDQLWARGRPLLAAKPLDLAKLDVLASEFESLALSCETLSSKSDAQRAARQVREAIALQRAQQSRDSLAADYQRQLDAAKDAQAKLRQRQEAARAKSRADAVTSAKQRVAQELLFRRRPGYAAKGVVVDRVRDGATVYYLEVDGALAYRLLAGARNLRQYWHKAVGINGRTVTYNDAERPALVIDALEVLPPEGLRD